MHHSHSDLAARRSLRFKGSIPALLENVAGSGPLYVHARNWMAELATILPLGGMVTDEEERTAMFPEQGLLLALGEVEEVHGVTIEYRSRQALALEFATRGEPRAVSIVALPNISDMEHFTRCIHRHPADILREEDYRKWREEFIVRPYICPCCTAASEERRADPERNPLARIFCHAIETRLALRCNVASSAIGFCAWLTPQSLQFSDGVMGAIGIDGKSMLELDFGICHSMHIARREIDNEAFSEISLYDSLGGLHLQIAARGWQHEAVWRGLCGEG